MVATTNNITSKTANAAKIEKKIRSFLFAGTGTAPAALGSAGGGGACGTGGMCIAGGAILGFIGGVGAAAGGASFVCCGAASPVEAGWDRAP